MVKIQSINKKCNKVTSTNGDNIYIQPKKPAKSFYEEVYSNAQKSGDKWVVDTIDKGKGHYLGFNKKKMEPGYYSKDVAIKKSINWMKKRGKC